MKVFVLIFLLFVPMVCTAEMDADIRLQMLDAQIEQLTKQRDERYAELKQCEKKTKGFKIAGITTMTATAVGIVSNIALAEKLKSSSSGGGGGKAPNYQRSEEEIKRANTKRVCKRNPNADGC